VNVASTFLPSLWRPHKSARSQGFQTWKACGPIWPSNRGLPLRGRHQQSKTETATARRDRFGHRLAEAASLASGLEYRDDPDGRGLDTGKSPGKIRPAANRQKGNRIGRVGIRWLVLFQDWSHLRCWENSSLFPARNGNSLRVLLVKFPHYLPLSGLLFLDELLVLLFAG